MKQNNKTMNCLDLIIYSFMMLSLALMNIIPVPISIARGQTISNQTSTTTLRIAVPVRGFSDFVKVIDDPITGHQNLSGFAIEAFKKVVEALPQPFSYEFVRFPKPDGTQNGTFDDMLKGVLSKDYDGAAGDISIVFYRTQWVDFTLPYTDTELSMLVPLKQQKNDKTSKLPLIRVTKGFVVATFAFSFIVAIVFWVMEHRNDKHASQPRLANSHPPEQYDDDWRREILRSVIQTRLVMVLFFMVLLVLIACYAASQTSSLAVTSQRVPINNLNQLIRMDVNVGYQRGSFIYNLLLNKGFSESKLIAFNTDEEMYNLLSEGGVAAVIGLTPHLQLRLNGHCDTLTLVKTFTIRTSGFGFAFPKESSLVLDMSNSILKLIDNGEMRRIQERTIGSLEPCQDYQNNGHNANFIDTDTLWILVAGAIGVFLLVMIVMLVHCGTTCDTTRKKKKAVAYPCYALPCC